jgi:arylformamidase
MRRMQDPTRRSLVAGALAVVALLVLLSACGGDDGSEASSTAPTTVLATRPPGVASCPAEMPAVRDVAYASDDAHQRLDVYPASHGCPAPVVVWVHGGGWQRGDKRNQMTDKVRLWNEAGYTVVSVNYRLTDQNSAQNSAPNAAQTAAAPVRFPTHDEDVAAAVEWVHDHIADYGGDPDRIALLGHSAGAQIAASVATDPTYLGEHGLSLGALRCAGALDTEGYDVAATARTGNPIYRAAFGDDPATWRDASPIEHVAAGRAIPQFLVVERGTARRRRAAEAFVDRLRDAGVAVTVVDAGSLSHAEVNSSVGRSGDSVVTPPLEAFLAECLAATP